MIQVMKFGFIQQKYNHNLAELLCSGATAQQVDNTIYD